MRRAFHSTPWFIRQIVAIPSNRKIEIRGFRYSYLKSAFEAYEILDSETDITYRGLSGWQPYESPWQDERLIVRVTRVVLRINETYMFLESVSDNGELTGSASH